MDPPFGVFPHARVRREAHRTAAEAAALPKKSTALFRRMRVKMNPWKHAIIKAVVRIKSTTNGGSALI